MSLFLSRLSLNPLFAPAIKLVASPEELHSKLYALLPQSADASGRSILFRVDTTDAGPAVLLQTMLPPDWQALELAPRALLEPPETKPYDPEFVRSQRLAFRLLARPSVRKSGDFGAKPNGKRVAGPRRTCREDVERLSWLERKGIDHGFIVESVGLTILSVPAIKSAVAPREAGGSFTAVRYDGVLVVADPDKLREAVRNGVGPQKAFGFGLLSLAPMGD